MTNKYLNKTSNISHDDYVFGNWRTKKMTEHQLFELLSTHLHDMIDGINIKRFINSHGDFYESYSIPVTENTTFEEYGLKVVRKDYFSRNKQIFCLELKYIIIKFLNVPLNNTSFVLYFK